MRTEERQNLGVPLSLKKRFDALSERLEQERGGKWTAPATLKYLLDLDEEQRGGVSERAARYGARKRRRK